MKVCTVRTIDNSGSYGGLNAYLDESKTPRMIKFVEGNDCLFFVIMHFFYLPRMHMELDEK